MDKLTVNTYPWNELDEKASFFGGQKKEKTIETEEMVPDKNSVGFVKMLFCLQASVAEKQK